MYIACYTKKFCKIQIRVTITRLQRNQCQNFEQLYSPLHLPYRSTNSLLDPMDLLNLLVRLGPRATTSLFPGSKDPPNWLAYVSGPLL